ncbi:MAG TPA: helix-turn-helix domain-containing protein [Anaeromyxobacteraceae bacterium]|nr:helix-turn-helix domain-containing protein [Anaeromyxobacteraceae bacterium]
MGRKPRCDGCGAELRDCSEVVSVTLPRCGVIASVRAPARSCAGCGEVRVDASVLRHAGLSIACELADRGIHSGDALRHMRKALGLRAIDLAQLLDVTPETISHWETGKALPTRAAFATVAAMVEEAVEGRTVTRDRLAAVAERRKYPRVLEVRLRTPSSRA